MALVYVALFFCSGALVVAATYLLVSHTLTSQFRAMNSTTLLVLGDQRIPSTKPVGVDADGGIITFGDLRAQISRDQQRALDSTLRTLLMNSLIATGAVGVLAVGAGWVAAGRFIGPIRMITGTARGIAGSNLHERIRMDGPADELKELADTFDAMLERLDQAFDGQRRFVANASHELRTPVAVSRTLIQVALGRPGASADLRELAGKLLEVNDRQAQITEALLTLARSESVLTDAVPVELAEVTAGALDLLAEQGRTTGLRCRAELADAPVRGDPVLLRQLVDNLLHNAVRHNIAGGSVWVRTGSADGTCDLVVTNTGVVLDAAEVHDIFEPFRRLGRERSGDGAPGDGFGLGLSIVRSIVRAHHGQVVAEPRPGGGLSVAVRLPSSPR